jgi:hypothetical protein
MASSNSYTPYCVTGTTEVYQPYGGPKGVIGADGITGANGECFCGATVIEPEEGYARGFCIPYPPDEGLSFEHCNRGAHEELATGGLSYRCGYYCTCAAKRENPGAPITCCKPKRDQGLSIDGEIIGETITAPPEIAIFMTTATVRMLTTTTTTDEPYYGAQKLMGTLELSTVLPFQADMDEFLRNSEVIVGVSTGIAMRLGVPPAWVSASLSVPDRHILVSFEIKIPPETRGNSSGIALFMSILDSNTEDGKALWSDALGLSMTKATSEQYQVAVHEIPVPYTVRLDANGQTSRAFRVCWVWSLLKALPIIVATSSFVDR